MGNPVFIEKHSTPTISWILKRRREGKKAVIAMSHLVTAESFSDKNFIRTRAFKVNSGNDEQIPSEKFVYHFPTFFYGVSNNDSSMFLIVWQKEKKGSIEKGDRSLPFFTLWQIALLHIFLGGGFSDSGSIVALKGSTDSFIKIML